MDERNHHGELRPDAAAKDRLIYDSYSKLNVDVINLSSHELRYASRLLKRTAGTPQNPTLGRLVSANIVADSANVVKPRPYLVRDITTKNGSVRVAFIGLTETSPSPPGGYKIIDPAGAARRAAEAARKEADVVIALARVKPQEAARIAAEAPGLDLMIVSFADTLAQFFTPPTRAGNTDIVFNTFETRMLGEVRFYRQQDGKFSMRLRYITLDDAVPDDAAGLAVVSEAKVAEDQARAESKKLLGDWFAKTRRPEPAGSGYVGARACAACHQTQYVKWMSSKHAQASDALAVKPDEFEAGCVSCHASDRKGNEGVAFVQGVECEECHGPGAAHAVKPVPGYGKFDSQAKGSARQLCLACHTAEVSPAFDINAALAAIKH